MLLKILHACQQQSDRLREAPPQWSQGVLLADMFGYNIIWCRERLYAVATDRLLDEQRLADQRNGDNVEALVFEIIDSLKNTPGQQPIHIDSAYGYDIRLSGETFEAVATSETGRQHVVETHAAIRPLYERLFERHRQDLEIYVHVGLPKTGTTYLQMHLFPYLPGVHYVSRTDDWFVKHFLKIRFGGHLFVKDEVAETFWEFARYVDERKILISEESLSEPRNNARHVWPNILAVKHAIPDAKILFTVRRQDNFLESFYRQDLRVGGTMSPNVLLRYDRHRRQFKEFEYTLVAKPSVHYLDYNVFADLYVDLFGRDNVRLFVYEKLLSEPDEFIAELCEFVGAPLCAPRHTGREHRSYCMLAVGLERWLNRLVWRENGQFGLLVERPLWGWLSHVIDNIDHVLPITHVPAWRRRLNWLTRYVVLVLRRVSAQLVVDNLIQMLDPVLRLLPQKRRALGGNKREMIRQLYAEKNRQLDRAWQLGLSEYGYYE